MFEFPSSEFASEWIINALVYVFCLIKSLINFNLVAGEQQKEKKTKQLTHQGNVK